MKKIILILATVALMATICHAAMTHTIYGDPTAYWWSSSKDVSRDPARLWAREVEDLLNATGGTASPGQPLILGASNNIDYLKFSGGYLEFTEIADAPADTNDGVLYADTDNNLYYRANGAWVDLTPGAGSVTDLDTAYNGGNTIDADGSPVTITVSDTDNNRGLDVVQNDTTNNPDAAQITNAGTGDGLQFASTGGGNDVNGTSSSWNVTAAGAGTFAGLTTITLSTTGTTALGNDTGTVAVASSSWDVTTGGAFSGITTLTLSGDLTSTAGDIVLATGKALKGSTTTAETVAIQVYDNDTGPGYKNAILLTNGNTPAIAIGDNNPTVAINSSTWDISTLGALTGIADITGTAGEAMTITLAADGAADDLTISVTGAQDSSVIIASAGTGTDAIKVNATAGGVDIDAADDLSLTVTSGGAGEDLLITQSGANDSSIILTAAGTGADAIQLSAAAGTVDIQGNVLNVDSTADMTVTVTSSEAGEDLLLVQSGGNDSSITATAAGTGADAIGLFADGTGGGISIDTDDGAISIVADGAANGDITLDAQDNLSLITLDTLTLTNATKIIIDGMLTQLIEIEGTANDYETTLTIPDPCQDNTITFPDDTASLSYTPTGKTTKDNTDAALPLTHAVIEGTSGAASAWSLANGENGQILTVVIVTDGGEATITPATATGWATAVLTDDGDTMSFLYVDDTAGWVVLGSAGIAGMPNITQ